MPTASASPPSVMMLSVSPIADSMMMAPSTDSGIDTAMMTVRTPAAEEQQDHHAGQQRRDHAFDGDALDGAADEHRLVADEADLQRLRAAGP